MHGGSRKIYVCPQWCRLILRVRSNGSDHPRRPARLHSDADWSIRGCSHLHKELWSSSARRGEHVFVERVTERGGLRGREENHRSDRETERSKDRRHRGEGRKQPPSNADLREEDARLRERSTRGRTIAAETQREASDTGAAGWLCCQEPHIAQRTEPYQPEPWARPRKVSWPSETKPSCTSRGVSNRRPSSRTRTRLTSCPWTGWRDSGRLKTWWVDSVWWQGFSIEESEQELRFEFLGCNFFTRSPVFHLCFSLTSFYLHRQTFKFVLRSHQA